MRRKYRMNDDEMIRWMSEVSEVDENDCWVWTRQVNHAGYGAVRFRKKMHRAHRLMYSLKCGPISETMVVRHRCHNTRCINPDHLLAGTSSDNALDSIDYHRGVKLSKVQLREVIELLAELIDGTYGNANKTYAELGSRYSVAPGTIKVIRFGQNRKRLETS